MDKASVWEQLRRTVLALLIFGGLLTWQSAFATQSVTLAWDPSPDPDVTGYNVYYGTSSRNYTNVVTVGSATNATVSGLVEGVTYYFAVTAFNSFGLESDFSNEVSYQVPTNAPPSIGAISDLTLAWNNAPPALPFTISDPDTPAASLSLSASSSNPALIPAGNISFGGSGNNRTVTVVPMPDVSGSATITIAVSDGNGSATTSFQIILLANQPPTLNALADLAISQDAPQQTVNLSGISSGTANENQTLTITAVSSNPGLIPNPTVSYVSPNSTGTLKFTPVAGATGSAVITVTVNDGQIANNTITRTFSVSVNAGNQPPTLNPLSDLTINENAGQQTVSLSGIGPGAANETQTLSITASSSNPGLIPIPTVSYTSPNSTGTLSFTPAPNSSGSAKITVTVNDGQPTNNLMSRTFTVTVNPVNHQPTLNALSNLTINENGGQQTVNLSGITSGSVSENQTLTVTASSSNPALIPSPTVSYTSPNSTGTLKFTPALNQFGSAVITVTVNDGQTTNNIVSQTFTVTVNAVNQTPSLDAISDVTINENAGQQTVNLSGITSGSASENQTLTITATSSKPGLIPNPTVSYTSPNSTGTLKFTPAANASGFANITVTVNDGQSVNSTVSRTFKVTVNAVNFPPTLDALSNLTINENAGQQTVNLSGINSGAANENQTLSITATSSNPGLIPNPTVNYTSPNSTGTLKFTPAANSGGSATISVTVNDGQTSSNTITRNFTVIVNRAPTITAIPDQNVFVNTNSGPISFTVGDVETAVGSLAVSADSSNPALIPAANIVFGGTGATRTVTLTPIANQTGSVSITITVSDGSATANTIFKLNVTARPPAPPGNVIILQTSGNGSISPNLTSLTIGQVYTVTAVPAADSIFVGWSGSLAWSDPKLTFLAKSNLVIQANFVPDPFAAASGIYSGLFYENDAIRMESSGAISIKVTKKGKYSAKLQMGKQRYGFSGMLNAQVQATNYIGRVGAKALKIILQFGSGADSNRVFGTVSDGTWIASLEGDRAVFNPKTDPAPYAGVYTLVIPGSNSDPAVPSGYSYGAAMVNTKGKIKFKCVLADGTKVSQSAIVSEDGAWPLYAPLYSGGGSLMGWLTFTNRTTDDLSGAVSWIKLAGAKSKIYLAGFTNVSEASGSVYRPTSGVSTQAKRGGSQFIFNDSALYSGFTNVVALDANGKMTDSGIDNFKLKFSSKNGMFKGKLPDLASGKSLPFGGVVLQKLNEGFGFVTLSTTNQTGEVLFVP